MTPETLFPFSPLAESGVDDVESIAGLGAVSEAVECVLDEVKMELDDDGVVQECVSVGVAAMEVAVSVDDDVETSDNLEAAPHVVSRVEVLQHSHLRADPRVDGLARGKGYG